MATTMCEIDGRRPAVATVRIRQNGEERTIAVCEEHLRELPGSEPRGRAVAVRWRGLFDEFFSDFFGDSGLGSRTPGAAGGTTDAPAPPGRADRRHRVLQRRHPPTAPACRAEGDGMGQPGR